MQLQFFIRLSGPESGPSNRPPLCQVFHTMGFLLGPPWAARWWATLSPQTSIHQLVTGTQWGCFHSIAQSIHLFLTSRRLRLRQSSPVILGSGPRSLLEPRPLSTPAPGGPGSTRPPLFCPFNHPSMPSFSSSFKYVFKPRHGKQVHLPGQVH